MLDGMRRQRAAYVFDKASQASSISSGGLWGCRGGNEQIARGWIIASRERLIVLCRVEEQSAPEIRASATPRRGGGTAVPFYEGGSGGQPTDPKAGGRSGADGPRSEGGKRILLDNSRVYVRFLPFLSGRVHLTRISAH